MINLHHLSSSGHEPQEPWQIPQVTRKTLERGGTASTPKPMDLKLHHPQFSRSQERLCPPQPQPSIRTGLQALPFHPQPHKSVAGAGQPSQLPTPRADRSSPEQMFRICLQIVLGLKEQRPKLSSPGGPICCADVSSVRGFSGSTAGKQMLCSPSALPKAGMCPFPWARASGQGFGTRQSAGSSEFTQNLVCIVVESWKESWNHGMKPGLHCHGIME